jgi:NADH-quinone oxidoreductase subunit E
VLPCVRRIQEDRGYVADSDIDELAAYLGVPRVQIEEVLSYYTMYRTAPAGKHVVQVCTTVSCMLRGADPVLAHIKQKLGVEVGETTPDGMFTLVTVECLGSCGTAPTIQVDDDYYEDMDIARTNEILDALARGEQPKPGPGPHRVYVE